MMWEFKTMKGGIGGMTKEKCGPQSAKKANAQKDRVLKVICDICQVMDHSTKDCLYNLRRPQVLFTQEQPSTSGPLTSKQRMRHLAGSEITREEEEEVKRAEAKYNMIQRSNQ